MHVLLVCNYYRERGSNLACVLLPRKCMTVREEENGIIVHGFVCPLCTWTCTVYVDDSRTERLEAASIY